MLKRTHLVVGIGAVLYFLDVAQLRNKLIFSVVVLIASLLPDLESAFFSTERRGIIRRFKMISPKQGILHTYTFCIAVAIFLALFFPVYAFPFFVGYSFHLFLDSFTPQGIRAFWPLKKRSKGYIHAGGKMDYMIFYILIIVDIALLIKLLI